MFNNLNVTLKKIMVVFLIITLTYANLVLIGSNIVNGLISYAANKEENAPSENVDEPLDEGEEEKNEGETGEEENKLILNIESKDIHKTAISEDGKVDNTGKLVIDLNQVTNTTSIAIEDVSKEFYKNDETVNEDIDLKYKTTTINKEVLVKLLGEQGKLVITDTVTNKVLVELTNNVLSSQELDVKVENKFIVTEENSEQTTEEVRTNLTVKEETVEIEYVLEVTNVKFELTNITIEQNEVVTENENTEENEPATVSDTAEVEKTETENTVELKEFIIENTKTISNITDIETLDYLQENIKYVINAEEQTANSTIKFKDTITRANLEVDNTEWVVGEANKVKYTITLDTTTEKSEMFVNPMFLIEMPSSVESINTANSEFTLNNDNGAFTGKRVFVTTVLGRKFVVITLEGEQTQDTIVNGNTTVDLTLELNVTEGSTEENAITKLYYQNDTVTAYESGKSFDTAQVTVSMIMESEPKYEIAESNNMYFTIVSSTQDIIKQENEFKYTLYLDNYNFEEKQNLQIFGKIPEGISILDVVELLDDEENEIQYNFDETTRELTINIDKIDAAAYGELPVEETGETTKYIKSGNKIIQINLKTNTLDEGIYSKEIKSSFKLLEAEKVIEETAEVINTISDVFITYETEDLPENVKEGEKATLGIKVTNKGLINSDEMDIKLTPPEEFSLIKYTKTIFTSDGQVKYNEEGSITDRFEVNNIYINAQETYYIQLVGIITNIEEDKEIILEGNINGEDVTWTTEAEDVVDNPTKPEDPKDSEESEKPSDSAKPNNPEKPDDSDKPNNPDGTEKPGQSEDLEDKKEGFDLSLNQYVNKVTVVNSKGTTTYNYEDTNFAKVEIHSKQMNGSKVTIEYKIIVKNEGTVPGYARKIVDYIPSDLKFNTELNPDWYLGDDGNIYSVSFMEKLLKPGETAEVKVILEKQMTNENVGTISNIVEICEATNSENVDDINSTPGDRAEGQNDISKVDVMVVTSTGTIILYTTLAIAVITIIAIGFYKIKKVALNKKGGC